MRYIYASIQQQQKNDLFANSNIFQPTFIPINYSTDAD